MPAPRTLLACLVAVALLAGCTGGEEAPPTTPATPPDGTTPPPTGGSGGNPPDGQTPPNPDPVTDRGAIQGPFEKSWKVNVPVAGPKGMTVHFNLTGVQAGAPPTARIFLSLADPDGSVVKSATIGLGGSGDKVSWPFSGADVGAAGDYVLTAKSEDDQGLPSGGLANYELFAKVEY